MKEIIQIKININFSNCNQEVTLKDKTIQMSQIWRKDKKTTIRQ